jgi:hypothetical protein
MKKVILAASVIIVFALASCGVGKKTSKTASAVSTVPEYKLLNLPMVDLSEFPKGDTGWITIFDGKTFKGWRGYNKETIPEKWTIEDNAIKFNGTGGGEAQTADGGDLVFAHKLKNFEFEFEWKVAKGSNSGVFILIQEVEGQPPYISSPEFQVLDNENHPDAIATSNGNRKSASLYDMIPAEPQNSKPYGEWNKGKIICFKGSIFHFQNDVKVLEYHLWTPQWTEMLQASKFSQKAWPLAFELLNNCGGPNREGLIGFQDHGDDVWFRNLKIKITD